VLYIDQTNPAFAPHGLLSGLPGRSSRILLRIDGRARRVPTKTTLTVPAGGDVVVETAGGGGWGPPIERDPDALAADVRDGVVTARGSRAYAAPRRGRKGA
jgi:N-methylhydantoinase B